MTLMGNYPQTGEGRLEIELGGPLVVETIRKIIHRSQ